MLSRANGEQALLGGWSVSQVTMETFRPASRVLRAISTISSSGVEILHCNGRRHTASYPVLLAICRNSSKVRGFKLATFPIGSEIRPERDSLIRGQAALIVRAVMAALRAAFRKALRSIVPIPHRLRLP